MWFVVVGLVFIVVVRFVVWFSGFSLGFDWLVLFV